jgi:PAS domain S-box-containing protein
MSNDGVYYADHADEMNSVTSATLPEKGTVLVADDMPESLDILFRYLKRAGYKVLVARDGQGAIHRAQTGQPDIILLDIVMPEMNGYETCRQLKADPTTQDIPVIFISGLDEAFDKLKAFSSGGVDYISKPLEVKEVLARVENHVKLAQLQRALQEKNRRLEEENAQRRRVLDALKQSREYYRLLAEHSTDMISRQNSQGIYIYISPAGRTLLGYELDEIISHTPLEFIHPDDLPAIQEVYDNLAAQPEVSTLTYRTRHKDGRYVWLETTLKIIRVGKAELIEEIIGVSRDVTERKEAEETIQQQNQFLSNIIESLANPFYVINVQDYTIQMANSTARAQGVATMRTCYALTHKRDAPCDSLEHPCPLVEVQRTRRPVVVEHIHFDKNGNPKNMEVHGYPIFNDKGEIIQMIEYSLDITERKQADEDLRKLSRAVEQSGSAIVITDLKGVIEFVNPAFSRITGYTPQEAVGRTPRVLKSGQHSPYIYQDLWETISRGEIWQGELMNRKKNGELYWEFATISPVKDQQGQTTHYLAVKEDITERKETERALQEAYQDLQTMTHRMQDELALAQEIQKGLLPSPQPGWAYPEVVCYNAPAREVGGDFYHYHAFDEAHFAFAVGDVSGKGVSAALLMASGLAQLDATMAQNLTPAERLAHLDTVMTPYTRPRRQNCALCYLELEVALFTGFLRLQIVNAGCIPPYVRRKNGRMEWPDVGGFALGQGLGAQMGYEQVALNLAPGDIIVLVSDGVVEAKNKAGQIFGFERMRQAIAGSPAAGASGMMAHIQAEVTHFMDGAEPHDDLTILVVQL